MVSGSYARRLERTRVTRAFGFVEKFRTPKQGKLDHGEVKLALNSSWGLHRRKLDSPSMGYRLGQENSHAPNWSSGRRT